MTIKQLQCISESGKMWLGMKCLSVSQSTMVKFQMVSNIISNLNYHYNHG